MGANYGGSSLQQAHSYHDASTAHTKLVKDSKQAMATTSTLLRYTIVVAPEVDADTMAAVQGPLSATLQVANSLSTIEEFTKRLSGKAGFSYQLLPQQPSLLLRLR